MTPKKLEAMYRSETGREPWVNIFTYLGSEHRKLATPEFTEWLMEKCCAWSRAVEGSDETST